MLGLFPETGKSTGGRKANISKTSTIYGGGKGLGQDLSPDEVRGDPGFGDAGSAARFFKQCEFDAAELSERRRFIYCAKASRKERGEGNTHSAVKPLALMRWLVRLVVPPGGTVLDPFMGSGSTLLAAQAEGVRAVGIESEERYCEIAASRLRGGGGGQG